VCTWNAILYLLPYFTLHVVVHVFTEKSFSSLLFLFIFPMAGAWAEVLAAAHKYDVEDMEETLQPWWVPCPLRIPEWAADDANEADGDLTTTFSRSVNVI